jgi:hypothetical protein
MVRREGLTQVTMNCCGIALCALFAAGPTIAQDLDPRAYARVPVNLTLVVAGFSYLDGGVVTDAASPIQDLEATVMTPSLGVGRTFSLFGQTAQAFAALPYAWAHATGLVLGQDSSTSAPSSTVGEFLKIPRQLVIGTSLTVVAPVGQYFPEKLINLGTNRWSFKPEIALSYPVDERWLLDVYAGVWLFTENNAFYPSNATRTQDPLVAIQAHVSYDFQPLMWAALNATFYAGGLTSVNGIKKNDRQQNMRLGGTFVLPVWKRHTVKLSCSAGAVVRSGANFTFTRVAKALGFTGPKLHSLRHTFGTYLIGVGYDVTVVRDLLGHEDIRTTLIYAKADPARLRDAIRSFEKLGGDSYKMVTEGGDGIGQATHEI